MNRARRTNPRLCEVRLVAGTSPVQRLYASVAYRARASVGGADGEARWSPCKVLILKGLNRTQGPPEGKPFDFRPSIVFSMSIADLPVRWLGGWVAKPKPPYPPLAKSPEKSSCRTP